MWALEKSPVTGSTAPEAWRRLSQRCSHHHTTEGKMTEKGVLTRMSRANYKPQRTYHWFLLLVSPKQCLPASFMTIPPRKWQYLCGIWSKGMITLVASGAEGVSVHKLSETLLWRVTPTDRKEGKGRERYSQAHKTLHTEWFQCVQTNLYPISMPFSSSSGDYVTYLTLIYLRCVTNEWHI